MGRDWLVLSQYKATPVGAWCGTGSLCGHSGWYLVVVGQYMVVLVYQEIGRAESVWGGICWYRVNIGPSCIYVIHGTVEIWSGVTEPSQMDILER